MRRHRDFRLGWLCAEKPVPPFAGLPPGRLRPAQLLDPDPPPTGRRHRRPLPEIGFDPPFVLESNADASRRWNSPERGCKHMLILAGVLCDRLLAPSLAPK